MLKKKTFITVIGLVALITFCHSLVGMAAPEPETGNNFINSKPITTFIKVTIDNIITTDIFMETVSLGEKTEGIETEIIPISDSKKQEIVDIASKATEIKTLLDQGAFIYMYYFDYIPAYLVSDGTSVWNKTDALQPLSMKDHEVVCDKLVEYTIRCWFKLDDIDYFFMLDMQDKSILIELQNLGEISDLVYEYLNTTNDHN